MALSDVQADPQTIVRLASETDFAGWREAARRLRDRRVAPEAVIWTVDGAGELLDPGRQLAVAPSAFTVPRAFLDLSGAVILHRSDERFSLLYRLLWRLALEPDLLSGQADPDVRKAHGFARGVAQAEHQMKAFTDFKRLADADGQEVQVGWFEPAHRVTEAAIPFFMRRFGARRFSVLTPDVCAHWDGRELSFTPGADPADGPRQDSLEDYWRARNPPRARLISEPIVNTEAVMASQTRSTPSRSAPPSSRVVRAAQRASRDASYDGEAVTTLEEIHAGVQMCRRCDLYRDATQGVSGEGPARAKLMFVGEQPGDQEDLAGRPFVGPAGQMFNKALAAAGVPRDQAFVTNAVKHFKHELRGKKRIHKTPNAGEVTACRWWLDNERRIVRPRVIVAMGATAALSVFGKPMTIGKLRQQALQLSDQAQGVVTYHPSYLLRLPDADAKAEAYAMFVEDLKFAWGLAA
ncbi:MAG TPA: UdgX family uracil-DNA binding protein [Phenylobacterium sp.]|nr:UdgX family uracil-DNA binding protein [Phenylobacterium sp.]